MSALFSLLFLLVGSIQAQKLFQLDVLNPSLIFYGSEFNQGDMVIISVDISYQLQVNALFSNFNTTKFHFFGIDNMTYTQIDVQNAGPKGLRVTGGIQFFMDQGTSNDFYVSFAICPKADQTATLGYDDYTLHLFDGSAQSSTSYTISADPNAYRMITIINKQYSKASCYNFDMQNIQFLNSDSPCSMRFYQSGPAGLIPGSLAYLYTLSFYNAATFVPPTLSAAYYTFLVTANCSVSFDLRKHVEGAIQIDGGYSHGFVASCDFPGTNFSRKESVKGFQNSFHATGRSPFPISIDVRGAPGSGGYLGVEILEQNELVTGSNFTVEKTMNLNGTAHDIWLNWVPGGTGRTGFLATFNYQGPIIEYFVVDKNPLVFDSTFSNFIEKVIEANGSYIQVNIQPLNSSFVSNIYFNDNSTRISIYDLIKTPTSFKDFVHVSFDPRTSYFLATFTSYSSESERDQLGLTDYTLISVGDSGTTPIQSRSQTPGKTKAITFFHHFSLEMALGNVQLANGCEANLYVHGIPSNEMKEKMLLYKFNSDNAAQFIRSDVLANAATLIVKENCDFSADVKAANNDLSSVSFQFGANGFVMSAEYPGNYDNSLRNTFYSIPIFQIFYKDTYLDPDAKYMVNVVRADPGDNGNCSIIITNTEKIKKKFETVYHTLNITSPVQNQAFQANGYALQVYWSPTVTKNGFLMTYTMEKSSFSTSILLTFMFTLKFLLD